MSGHLQRCMRELLRYQGRRIIAAGARGILDAAHAVDDGDPAFALASMRRSVVQYIGGVMVLKTADMPAGMLPLAMKGCGVVLEMFNRACP